MSDIGNADNTVSVCGGNGARKNPDPEDGLLTLVVFPYDWAGMTGRSPGGGGGATMGCTLAPRVKLRSSGSTCFWNMGRGVLVC